MTKIFVTLPSNAEVSTDADVVNHWLDNKPLKMHQGNWMRRDQEGILKLMGVREIIVVRQLLDLSVVSTTILVG